MAGPARVFQGISAGPVFETAVFGELLRLFAHRGEVPRIHFFRSSAGHEVDFLVESHGLLYPVEARLTATPLPKHAEGIVRLHELMPDRLGRGLVVCLARERFPLAREVDVMPLGGW